ncbi:hypothetical protein C0Z18_17785 [Trinickia dabaoshanensis]|uniref:Uncharacterized protein n=1 Tax=Trinickia dabaoshanensis TaxID=564714 RepID=A0A2N7VLR5_9BURK|nr:hypothetical protein [Trinickia dabaoshanensis]PMS18089.1 hypothetical protein C0Z18_17785 [Trinickia dabaoshanensis]
MTANAERHVFFSIAAMVCRVLLVGAIVSMLFVGISMIARGAGGNQAKDIVPVSVATVLADIPGTQSENDGSSSAAGPGYEVPNAAGIQIPKPLVAVLTRDATSQRILNAWLDDIPARDRRDFVAGLTKVINAANEHTASWEWDNRQRYVAAAMSEYARMAIDRVTEIADAQKRAAEQLAGYRNAMGTLLGIAATLTLLLTVMAIERNTRPR